jgi:Flp pilus assembly protein TadD
MNRKQRRAAASQNKRVAGSSSALKTTDAATVVNSLMNSALQCHQAGQLGEAERRYPKILALDPNHIGSLHNLGLIAYGRGQYEFAITFIGKAIALNDRIPDCHNSIGMALCALGRLEDAVAHY